MRIGLVLAAIVLVSILPFVCGQSSGVQNPKIAVEEEPPEPIPAGADCHYESGYLENSDGNNHLTTYSAAQIGDYVDSRLKSGHTVRFYPQPGGKVFVVASCGGAAE